MNNIPNVLDLDALLNTASDPPKHEWSLKIGDKQIPAINLGKALINPPPQPKEIIHGILRQGYKMMVTAASKAGKTWLMLELACAIATGKPWMGRHPVKQGKVLYLNMELPDSTIINRFKKVADALHVPQDDRDNITMINLRGQNICLSDIVYQIAEAVRDHSFDIVILDPIYKLFEGSENEQQVVNQFCEGMDIIANAGASVVYTHHHSKGAQWNKSAMDRGSGSGVFARDVDALMDWLEVNPEECSTTSPDVIEAINGNTDAPPRILLSSDATPYHVEWTLRDFKTPPVEGAWFDFPLHRYDTTGTVVKARPKSGRQQGGRTTGERKKQARSERAKVFVEAFSEGVNSLKEMSTKIGVCTRTIRSYAKDVGYVVKGDLITKE